MVRVPEIDLLDFLVERKFGAGSRHADVDFPPSLSLGRQAIKSPELGKEVAEYKTELQKLPSDQFNALLDSERRKQAQERTARIEREERERFFNQPYAQADFDHWSRAAHWTLDEAVALSFGKAPERVNWDIGATALACFEFCVPISTPTRSRAAGQGLEAAIRSGSSRIFLAWAKRTDLESSPELEAAVTARGSPSRRLERRITMTLKAKLTTRS